MQTTSSYTTCTRFRTTLDYIPSNTVANKLFYIWETDRQTDRQTDRLTQRDSERVTVKCLSSWACVSRPIHRENQHVYIKSDTAFAPRTCIKLAQLAAAVVGLLLYGASLGGRPARRLAAYNSNDHQYNDYLILTSRKPKRVRKRRARKEQCSYSSLYNYFHKYVTIYNFIAGRIKNISLAHAEFGSVVGLSDDPTGLFVSPFVILIEVSCHCYCCRNCCFWFLSLIKLMCIMMLVWRAINRCV